MEARRRSPKPKELAEDPYHLKLHPDLVLSKKQLARHMLIGGGVGGGKTQVLLGLLEQIIAQDRKVVIYDVKGDFSAKFRRPIIVSPYDQRSYVWDVARDIRTPTQAAAFAASLIPEEQGNGKFWTIAAQQLLTGSLRYLQNTRGIEWGWTDLAQAVAQGAEQMLPVIQAHYPKAASLIANSESQSTASVLATLAGYTRVIDDLALAWPKRSKRSFSITEWAMDEYQGRKQIIVQAGADSQLTRAYIAAMINVAVPAITGPALPDNESGRFLGFILDELPSIGRLSIERLLLEGRSKGVVCVLCYQDLAQLELIYGKELTQTIASNCGTKIVCQVQAGETRDRLAQSVGKHKVAWMTHDEKAQVHEESRGIVSSVELTDKLGFRKGSRMGPHGWGIRAIVMTGGDPLLLDFPGIELPDKREGQVAAKWTKGPAGGVPLPAPAPQKDTEKEVEAVLGLSLEEVMAREAARIYGD